MHGIGCHTIEDPDLTPWPNPSLDCNQKLKYHLNEIKNCDNKIAAIPLSLNLTTLIGIDFFCTSGTSIKPDKLKKKKYNLE